MRETEVDVRGSWAIEICGGVRMTVRKRKEVDAEEAGKWTVWKITNWVNLNFYRKFNPVRIFFMQGHRISGATEPAEARFQLSSKEFQSCWLNSGQILVHTAEIRQCRGWRQVSRKISWLERVHDSRAELAGMRCPINELALPLFGQFRLLADVKASSLRKL